MPLLECLFFYLGDVFIIQSEQKRLDISHLVFQFFQLLNVFLQVLQIVTGLNVTRACFFANRYWSRRVLLPLLIRDPRVLIFVEGVVSLYSF